MTWTTPTTRSTGDLITAAIWNQDMVDNVQHLHDRQVIQYLLPALSSNYQSSPLAPHNYANLQSTYFVPWEFYIPDDFASLDSLDVVYRADVGGTAYLDASTVYAADGEAWNNHTGSWNEQSVIVDGNVDLLDVSSLFASVAAGDYCTLRLTKGSTAWSGVTYLAIFGLRLIYTRG